MNTGNSFISKKNLVIQIFFSTIVLSTISRCVLVLNNSNSRHG
ncbi:hypothetical protein [Segatella copri]|nr:hypothetical protein [Segatella copri]